MDIFCKIIRGEMPCFKLYEDDFCIAILDAFPTVDGHTLIIPKEHIEDYTKISDETLAHIHKVAQKLGVQLMEKLQVKSLMLAVNYGDRQAVKHYHLHILPDYGKAKVTKKVDEMYEFLTK